MKIVCTVISVILILGFVFLVYIMQNNTLTSSVNNIPDLNFVVYSIFSGVIAFSAGYILNQGNVEELKNTTIKHLRKTEKANIDTKESLDKIDRLNSKIETLEIALQEALNNKKDN